MAFPRARNASGCARRARKEQRAGQLHPARARPAPNPDALRQSVEFADELQALTSASQIRTLSPADADAWAHYYLGAECDPARAPDAILAAVGVL